MVGQVIEGKLLRNEHNVVIAGGCRTAIGSFMGAFPSTSPIKLGGVVVRESIQRAGINPDLVEEVIIGSVLVASHGQNVGRQVSVAAGIPFSVPAYTINKVCGSSMKAIMLGIQGIRCGDAEVVVAGGVENMSLSPHLLPGLRKGYGIGTVPLLDSILSDGLTDAFHGVHMGLIAERIAERYCLSREDQDRFAVASQNKAEAAIKSGRFREEIVAVEIPDKKGVFLRFAQDEHPRFGSTVDALAKLKPAFKLDGTITAGNASGINDGAAAVVLMSKEKAKELHVSPLLTIRGYGAIGVDPGLMGLGPVPATRKALARGGCRVR